MNVINSEKASDSLMQVNHVMQIIHILKVFQVIQVKRVMQVRLAHLWFDFGAISLKTSRLSKDECSTGLKLSSSVYRSF